jgi:hypothetical protein
MRMRALKKTVILLALCFGAVLNQAQAQPRSPIYTLWPPQLGAISFLWDDCGDPARGEKFRTDFLDGLKLCGIEQAEAWPMADVTRKAIEEARVKGRYGPSIREHSICTQRPEAVWGLLDETERTLAQWRAGAVKNVELARSICSRKNPTDVQ